jgi:VanZ family protein
MKKIRINSFLPGLLTLVTATVLFCLPGDKFPDEDWFNLLKVDKLIHIGLFALLVLLWSLPFINRSSTASQASRMFIRVALLFVLYGIVIEFIQGNFIPFRSMGVDDMIADALGCAAGFLIARKILRAGKPA